MSKLDVTIKEIQDKIRAIAGIKFAPPYPTDALGRVPTVLTFPFSGMHEWNTSQDTKALHTILVQFHYPSQDLPRAVEEAVKYSESIPQALFQMVTNDQFTHVDTFLRVDYRFIGTDWAEIDTVGFEFLIIDVKIKTNIE